MKWSGNIFILLSLVMGSCSNESESDEIAIKQNAASNLIPSATEFVENNSIFCINDETTITAFEDATNEAEYLKKLIEASSQFEISINYTKSIDLINQHNTILLFNQHQTKHAEAYDLVVNEDAIKIMAMSNKGLMHGIQTLRQLLPEEFQDNIKQTKWCVEGGTIKDSPRFSHRGLLLDCSRHFFKKEVIKKYIDLLAYYKMNTLHWHLTEDQGWRIAIDKYPKLTEVAAWRKELDGSTYGGFYTKEDIKEIVAYAQERHITIIPEIELPGHSQAAIAAYPQLSCTGEQVAVANDWGVFKEIYCAGNDSVFTFLEDVLTEVMELFPSEYIHIGGDEAPKYRWENCNKCQARIKQEGLKDEHELQSYFISRIEKFLNENDRQLIGWDEILEGGLSPNATVQSWRGMEGGIEAAEKGHKAIMSPTSHCYLDYDLKAIDLEKVYRFDPIPEDLEKDKHHFILGGEVNMWTERVPDEENLDSKVFPRLLAMSEVLWSYPEERNYDKFYTRVQQQYHALDAFGVTYGLENNPAKIDVTIKEGQVLIHPKAGNKDLRLKYNWGCDTCNSEVKYEVNDNEIRFDKSGVLSVYAYKKEDVYGDPVNQAFEYHSALTKTVTYTYDYNQWYTAGGEFGLVDGKVGSLDFRDGNWQGFWGTDVEVIVDLGELNLDDPEQSVTEISTNFYQYNNSWIFLPMKVEFYISRDGKRYENVPTIPKSSNIRPKERGNYIQTYRTGFERDHIRYVKVKATNIGKVPNWHEAAGSDAWLFMDEIIVR